MTRDVPRFPLTIWVLLTTCRRLRPIRRAGVGAAFVTGSSVPVEPRPFGRSLMGDGAAGRLPDQTRVFGKRSGAMPGWWLRPFISAPCQFVITDQNIHPARAGIDTNPVAFAHQRQRAADEGFRRDISDAHAARCARETPVGDKGDFLAHPLAVDQCGDAKHLAHAGAADRAFVPDDEHVAFTVLALPDGLDTRLLILEHPRGALEQQLLQAGDLDHGTIWTKISLENG